MGSVMRNLFVVCVLALIHSSIVKLTAAEQCGWFCPATRTEHTEECIPAVSTPCQQAVGAGSQTDNNHDLLLNCRLSAVGIKSTQNTTIDLVTSEQVITAVLVQEWIVDLDTAASMLYLAVEKEEGSLLDPDHSLNPRVHTQTCMVYNISAQTPNTSKQLVIRDTCSLVDSSGVYRVSMTSPTYQRGLVYRLKIPQDLVTALGPVTPEMWEPVVGISVVQHSELDSDVHVVMETPNAVIGAWYNIITLRDSGTMDYKILHMNTTDTTFDVIFVKGAFTEYYAIIELFGSACEGELCLNLTTPRVNINAVQTTADVRPTTSTSQPVTGVQSSTPNTGEPPLDHPTGKYIIIGLVVAIVLIALFLVFGFMIYRWWKQRHRRLRDKSCTQGPWFGDKAIDDIELAVKTSPSVLILYSCDCERHEQVIVEFASYLKHTFYCTVSMDLWEQHDIQNRGAISWLLDKLDTSSYVMVVCSAGARLKCVRGRAALRPREDRPVPDIFPTALDYVTEKMWLMRTNDKSLDNFLVVCFDYAGENDIPPKLDLVQRYYLPADLARMFCHIYCMEYCEDMTTRPDFEGRTLDTVEQTETGKQLIEAVASAKQFFANNPNWLLEEIERDNGELTKEKVLPTSVPAGPSLQQVVPPPSLFDTVPPPSTDHQSPEVCRPPSHSPGINSPDNLSQRTNCSEVPSHTSDPDRLTLSLGGNMSTSSLASEEDAALLEQRNRKRQQDLVRVHDQSQQDVRALSRKKSPMSPVSPKVLQDGWFSMVRHSKKLMRQLKGKPALGYSNLSEEHAPSRGDPNAPLDGQHKLVNGEHPDGMYTEGNSISGTENGNQGSVPVPPQNGVDRVNGTQAYDAGSDDNHSLCSVEQLQKDCDFIQNFDIDAFTKSRTSGKMRPQFDLTPLKARQSATVPPNSDRQLDDHDHSFTNPMYLLSPLGDSTSVIKGTVPVNAGVPSDSDANGYLGNYPLNNNNNHQQSMALK